MLDVGIHPGLSGMDALPFVDHIEAEEIDLLLVRCRGGMDFSPSWCGGIC